MLNFGGDLPNLIYECKVFHAEHLSTANIPTRFTVILKLLVMFQVY